jgi:hypothetical protein
MFPDMRMLIGASALLAFLAACAPREAIEPESSLSFPVELTPSVMDGLPDVLLPYQQDWPDYWKGSVRGTRALSENDISVWLVELLGAPFYRAPYCVSQGAVWTYEVVDDGLLDHGPSPSLAASHQPESNDCVSTLAAPYFSVDPALSASFPDVLESAADVLACLEDSSLACPRVDRYADVLYSLAGRDPYDPRSVTALGSTGARVTYTIGAVDRTDVVRLNFRRSSQDWTLSEADVTTIANPL